MASEEKTGYAEEGYTLAKVRFDKLADEGCVYLLKTKRGELLEVMDLPEEFREDGLAVWVKFSYQRRQSRCAGAQPIGIERMLKKN